MDRVIRAKKPYAVAAAAMLLIGTAAFALGSGMELRSVSDQKIDDGIKTAKGASSAYGSADSEYNKRKTKSKETQEQVKLIIAGREERLNWSRFLEVETASMPRPGDPKKGGNLEPTVWMGSGNVGLESLNWFTKRMRDGVKLDDALSDANSKHPANLAMVNVEAVNTRWVTDLGAFLEAVVNHVFDTWSDKIGESMKDEEREMDEAKGRLKPKKIEGVGWVVEIRGFTDHRDGPQFIKRALLTNLQNMDKFATAKDENKIAKYIVGVPDPVKGKVSHAFLFKWWQVDSASANTFYNINDSKLDLFLPSDGGGSGGSRRSGGPSMGTSMPSRPDAGLGQGSSGLGDPAAAAASTSAIGPAWSGLTSTVSAGGIGGYGGGTGGGAMQPAGIAPPTVSAPKQPGIFGGAKEVAGKDDRRRFEFVVMLIWREPVPKIEPNTEAGSPSQ